MEQSGAPQTTMLSLSSEGSSNKESTTIFVAPGQVAERVVVNPDLPIVNRAYQVNTVKEISDYLAKPIPVSLGAWSTASTDGTLLFNQAIWVGCYGNAMWMNKLYGFYGLKCTIKVEVVLNATPFQQGRLRLCYYPAASTVRSKSNQHTTNRIPLSQLPGIEMSTADASMSLNIPYVHSLRFMELTGPLWDHGDVYLAVMASLQTGAAGPTTADYTIWYSMHDVELFGQSTQPISAPQSGTGTVRSKKSVPPSEKEMKPISHLLGAGANFAAEVAKVPLLSLYAGPVSWFLNAAKGAAMSFGFSKPLNSDRPCLMSMNYHYQCTTSDGFDNSIPLAVLYDNKLRILDSESNQGRDEMSIPFIVRQWSYLNSFFLNTSNTQGQELYDYVAAPSNQVVTAGTYEVYRTPVGLLSRMFKMYRGGLEIAFKLVKTGFHAGSLAVTFVSGPYPGSVDLTTSAYAYRTIVDIQEGDYMCFRLPYLLPLDYADTNIAFGRLFVNVVNPLRAPETCAQSFEVLVYIRGDESLQFQLPDRWMGMPIVPQGGDVENTSTDIVCAPIGDAPVSTLQFEFAQESMSEYTGSLLQLLKRYNPITLWVGATLGTTWYSLWPWGISSTRYVTTTYTTAPGISDYVSSQIHSCYAFMRGGVRIRVGGGVGFGDTNSLMITRVDAPDTFTGPIFLASNTSSANIYKSQNSVAGAQPAVYSPIAENLVSNGGLSAQVPYQGPYRMTPIYYHYFSGQSNTFFDPRPLLQMYVGTDTSRIISRSYADDYQAIFWVGVPRFDS
jgi:hypothetical protein